MKPILWLLQAFGLRLFQEYRRPDAGELRRGTALGFLSAIRIFIAEFLLLVAPAAILIIVHLVKGTPKTVFTMPEWSFMAAVVFAQVISRMHRITAAVKRDVDPEGAGCMTTVVLTLGFLPALLFLVLILILDKPHWSLFVVQSLWFFFSVVALFVFTLFECLGEETGDVLERIFPGMVAKKPSKTPTPPDNPNTGQPPP